MSLIFRTAALFGFAVATLSAHADVLFDNVAVLPNFGFNIDGTNFAANRFATSASNFALSNVTMSGARGVAGLVLGIYTDVSDRPGLPVGNLTMGQDLGSSDNGGDFISFDGNGLPLAANSRFWVVAMNPTGSSAWTGADDTTNAGSTPTAANGIDYSTDAGATYTVFGGSSSLLMSVTATPLAVPEPAMVAALGLGALAMLRRRKRA